MARTVQKLGYDRGTYNIRCLEDGKLVGTKRFAPSDYSGDGFAIAKRERDAWVRKWIARKVEIS